MAKYVNIGSGFTAGAHWINYDASPTLRFERLPLIGALYTKNATRFPEATRYGNIVRGPLEPAGTVDGVFCSHMLEHVPLADMRASLANILTMLKPGGVFRLIVPDLASRCRQYVANEGGSTAANTFVRASGLGVETSLLPLKSRLLHMMGNSSHRWMYDEVGMRQELTNAGFVQIRRCTFGDSADRAFAEVEDQSRFVCEYGPELALECLRPPK